MGLLTVSDLRVEQARIFGVVSNAINGISRPVLYARFNGFVVRPLDVEEPQQHDRGGMSARFSGAIRAEDLSDLGLVIDICAVGVAAPIGSLGFSRLEPLGAGGTLIRMELEIGHLRRSMAIEASTLLHQHRAPSDAQLPPDGGGHPVFDLDRLRPNCLTTLCCADRARAIRAGEWS